MRMITDRLELIAGTPEMVRAEMSDRSELSLMLCARIPQSWPPELVNWRTLNFCLQCLSKGEDQVGWSCWYIILREARMLIGMAEFTGRPGPEGSAEIGYTILRDFQNQGYGVETVVELIDWAFGHSEVNKVIAETTPDRRQSIRVLEKCGFISAGEGSHVGTIRFELPRGIYAGRLGHSGQAGVHIEIRSA